MWERGSCVVCERGEASFSIYSHGNVGSRENSTRSCMEPSWRWHQEMPRGRRGRLAPLGVRAFPSSSSTWRFVLGPGSCLRRCLAQIRKVGRLLSLFLFYALSESIFLSPFPLYLCICPKNNNLPIQVEIGQSDNIYV